MTVHVALLRGINLAGRNRIAMADLRSALTDAGLDDVATYIQSGNVVVRSELDEADLVRTVTTAISDRFGLDVPCVARTVAELAEVAAARPLGDPASDPKMFHVFFLDREPDATSVDGLDHDHVAPDRFVVVGRHVHVHHPDGSARSKLDAKWLERGMDVTATARNHNTIVKLLAMADALGG